MRIAALVSIALLSSTVSVGHAAVGDVPTVWTPPQSVASGQSPLDVADTDAMGTMAVAVVMNDDRAGDTFDIYTATGDAGWIKRQTLAAATVGTTTGRPQIATDGQGWAVTWQRAVGANRWEVVVATSAQANTSPTVKVLSTDLPAGYVQTPDPVIDAAPNDNVVTGPRYLVAWVSDAGAGTAQVRASEMHSQRQWTTPTLIQSYASTTGLSGMEVAYAEDRSAAIGYVRQENAVSIMTVASRAVGGSWTPGFNILGPTFGRTSGAWDLDMAETATHVSVAWASPDAGEVRYARVQLGTGNTVAAEDLPTQAGTSTVASVVVTDRQGATVVVGWSEQEAASQRYRIRSYVRDLRDATQEDTEQIASGETTGSISMQAGMNDDGRVWLAYGTSAAITVLEAGPAAPANFWTNAKDDVVTDTLLAGVQLRGFGLLVPSSEDIYPRVLWAQSHFANYSLSTAQEIPNDVTAPGAPTGVVAIRGDGEVDVRWTPPGDDGGSPILGYTVTSNPGGLTCESSGNACTVTGLTNGTAYTFTVTARNAVGSSVASTPSAPVTPSVFVEPPSRLKVKAKSGGRMVVRWPASASADGYVLGIRKEGRRWRVRDMGTDRVFQQRVQVGQQICYRVASVGDGGVRSDWTDVKCKRGKR